MTERILRIDMTTLSGAFEDVPVEWQGIGGRALTSAVVAKEVPPTCHPLGRHNKLVFAPGLLAGSPAAQSGRLSAGAKSPLTGTIKESNAGGTAAQNLARLRVKALIIEGKPADESKFYSIRMHNQVAVAARFFKNEGGNVHPEPLAGACLDL